MYDQAREAVEAWIDKIPPIHYGKL